MSTEKEKPNAIATEALAAIEKIKEKAKLDMAKQADKIKEAVGAIVDRIKELEKEKAKLDEALAEINGKAVAVSSSGGRGSLSDLRGRIVNWLKAHKDESYSATAIKQHFPELGNRPFTIVMKAQLGKEIKAVGEGRGMEYQAA